MSRINTLHGIVKLMFSLVQLPCRMAYSLYEPTARTKRL
jgi:hypothetical protein